MFKSVAVAISRKRYGNNNDFIKCFINPLSSYDDYYAVVKENIWSRN
jgi:hypothetical protein